MSFIFCNSKKRLLIMKVFVLILFSFFSITYVHAGALLESGIPVVGEKGAQYAPLPGLATYINYLYIFVLGVVGFAGFISLVIWGTVWVASGVIDKKALALEKIKSTFIGIGIALTAFIMLYTINPDLTVIKIPTTPSVSMPINASQMHALVQQAIHSVADGSKCMSDLQCYVGSTCAGDVGDTVAGVCERIAGICFDVEKPDGKDLCEKTGTGAGSGGSFCKWCQVGSGYRCASSCN